MLFGRTRRSMSIAARTASTETRTTPTRARREAEMSDDEAAATAAATAAPVRTGPDRSAGPGGPQSGYRLSRVGHSHSPRRHSYASPMRADSSSNWPHFEISGTPAAGELRS